MHKKSSIQQNSERPWTYIEGVQVRHPVDRRLVVEGEKEGGRVAQLQVSLGLSAASQYNLSRQPTDRSRTRSRSDHAFLRKHGRAVWTGRRRIAWSALLRDVRDDEYERGRNAA